MPAHHSIVTVISRTGRAANPTTSTRILKLTTFGRLGAMWEAIDRRSERGRVEVVDSEEKNEGGDKPLIGIT